MIDPQVWKACAGTAACIPIVGTRVCYFPQGHAEQASSPPDFSAVPRPRAIVLCWISAVRLLSNPDTDEVFASISLDPRVHSTVPPPPPTELLPPSSSSPLPEFANEGGGGGGFVSFAKILTASDANNGGGFSVPRFCADSIFPPLDFKADPPVQIISVCDVHGKSWNFRHIYRGTPRRHLLTTGWSKFVNSKKLIAGDSVVFMKNLSGQLFVGIRRTSRSCGPTDYSPYNPAAAAVKMKANCLANVGFSRNVKGRVPAFSVVEAVRLAGMDLPFEVLYYPRAGSPDFVVAEEAVVAAMRVCWIAGTRVRMSVETEDSARMTWFQGTVSKVAINDVGLWLQSPWRMLQITWDEPEVMQNVRSVSPWQVELVSDRPDIDASILLIKKFKAPESSESLDDRVDSMLFRMTGLERRTIDSLPSLFNYSLFPAGMQGARHDSIRVPGLCNSVNDANQMFLNGLHGVNAPQKNGVSIELSIGVTTQSGGSSPPSQGSIEALDGEILEPASSSVKKACTRSFQLFGQVIHIEQPINDDDADREYEVAKGGGETQGSFPPRKQVVIQCPRVSA